jgi:hypothetical protein
MRKPVEVELGKTQTHIGTYNEKNARVEAKWRS